MKRLIFILSLFLLTNGELNTQNILRIKFAYGNEKTSCPIVASCTPESFNFCFDNEMNFLITYDKVFIDKFSKLYNKLEFEKFNRPALKINPKIMCIVSYNNDSIQNDTICFGKFNGICKKGVIMKDNRNLLNLIKKKIAWKTH